MKTKVKEQLIKALKSKDYRQGRGMLKYNDAKGNTCHCALGMLCELYAEATGHRKGTFVSAKPGMYDTYLNSKAEEIEATGSFSFLGSKHEVHKRVAVWAQLSYHELDQIITYNDDSTGSGYNAVIKYISTL